MFFCIMNKVEDDFKNAASSYYFFTFSTHSSDVENRCVRLENGFGKGGRRNVAEGVGRSTLDFPEAFAT